MISYQQSGPPGDALVFVRVAVELNPLPAQTQRRVRFQRGSEGADLATGERLKYTKNR